MKGLELALDAKKAQLASRARDIEEWERELTPRSSEVAWRERRLEQAEPYARQEYERVAAELEVLERQRDELQLAIEREAEAHDMELVVVGDAPVA